MDLPRCHGEYAAHVRGQGQGHGIHQVLGAVGSQRTRGTHGGGQHHGLRAMEHFLQEPCGFFQGVGAMGDHHTLHRGAVQVMLAPAGKLPPDVKVHVLAVDLGDLLSLDGSATCTAKSRNRCQQVTHAHLRSLVADVVCGIGSRARNGSAGAQDHNFLPTHLHTPKNW